MDKKQNLIWIDLEMTGLFPDVHVIIEIATLITDAELNILAEGPVFAIHQPKVFLEVMDEWNTTHHGSSGLIDRVKASTINGGEAQRRTLEFLQQHSEPNASPMCGNSICQDRRFLARHMPELEAFFHYRNLDVSTVKELAMRWKPEIMAGINKVSKHRALDDIRDSVDELRYYRRHFFIQ